MFPRTIILILLTALPSFAAPVIIHGPDLSPINGHTYYVLSSSNWLDAEAKVSCPIFSYQSL